MTFFNLGKKDEYGRQRRIEHRGRFLRASRTGGVALRAQAKVAGLSVTGNTRHGLRVSVTPVKNTQLAMQNGRFILRGRYGRGPTRLNLSRSGLTVSTRNALGAFNWIRPERSSARIAGIQVRGRKAAQLQLIYMAITALFALARAAWVLAVQVFRLALWLGAVAVRLVRAVPTWTGEWRRRLRNARLERLTRGLRDAGRVRAWDDDQRIAAVAAMIVCWGRGEGVETLAARNRLERATAVLAGPVASLDAVLPVLSRWQARRQGGRDWHLARVARVADALGRRMPSARLADVLFAIDGAVIADGERTVLQGRMLEVFADFAGLRLEPEPVDDPSPETGTAQTDAPAAGGPVDLNTASLEALQAIPHLGPERARAVVAMRPIRELEALRDIDGIGPRRLAAIREYGVVCSADASAGSD